MTPNDGTPLHLNVAIGFIIGISEAYINHPLWTLKNQIQQRKTPSYSVRVLYRGVMTHAASSVPLDAIQTTASRMFLEHQALAGIPKVQRRLIAGFLGGCLGSFISTPAEMIMIRQQEKNSAFIAASRDLWQIGKIRAIYKGLMPTLGRDSLFCCSFFAGVPILRKYFQQHGVHSGLAAIFAGIVSGSSVAVISQPFDTIKTLVQSEGNSSSSKEVVSHIVRNRGFKGLFSGLILRIGRVTSGVLILGVLNDHLEKVFLGKHYN